MDERGWEAVAGLALVRRENSSVVVRGRAEYMS